MMRSDDTRENGVGSWSTPTRRQILGGLVRLGCGAVALRFGGLSSAAEGGSETVENTLHGFSADFESVDGVKVRAAAEPGRISFVVEGRIKAGRPVRLIPRLVGDHNGAPQEGGQQGVEDARRLLAVGGTFVTPQVVAVAIQDFSADVRVDFMFAGEEDPGRHIRLTLRLRDAGGRELLAVTRECADGRILAREWAGKTSGSRRVVLSMSNSERLEIDKELARKIGQIEVVFEDA
jgi:hypothetical protein